MFFDTKAALAEILATLCDTRDIDPERPHLSRMSRLSQGVPPETETQPKAQPRTPPAQRPEPEGFPYGFAMNGYPLTWTGRPVSREAWAHLSLWERLGSTGMLWNGLTRQWEPIEAEPPVMASISERGISQ